MSQTCPDLEVLFDELHEGHRPALEHAKSCESCAAILEEHRQLEKDLYRLADPLPPPDFVHKVMQKVADSPTPLRSELVVFGAICGTALLLGAVTFLAGEGNWGALGARLASALVEIRAFAVALASGLSTLWKVAELPLTGGLFIVLMAALFGLRRLVGASLSEAQVSP